MNQSKTPVSLDIRAVLDASDTMTVITDVAGIIQIFNGAAERLLHWRAVDVVGRHTLTLWHDAVEITARASELSKELGRTVSAGFEVLVAKAREQLNESLRWTLIRKDGNRFPVQLVVSAIRDATGKITGYLAQAQVVTAREKSERENDLFFNASLDMLGIASIDGYFKRINPAFTRVLGWTEDEFLSRPFLDFVHPDDRTSTLGEVAKLAAGQPTLYFENRYRRRDDSWCSLAWTCTPHSDGTLHTVGRDITQLKKAEMDLRQSQQDLAITLNSIGDAVIVTDAGRRITRMNPVAEQLTGWPQSEAVDRQIDKVFRIISEETRDPAVIPIDDVLATGMVHGLANHTALIARDGTEISIADSAAPIRDDSGNINGVVLVFRDVTDERRYERELQQLNADLERRVDERTKELAASGRFNQATLDALSAHVAVLDERGIIVKTNRAWKEFAQANQAMLRNVAEKSNYLVVCDRSAERGDVDASMAAKAIRQVIAGEQEHWLHEYPCHAPNEQRWFYCRVTRFPSDGAVHIAVAHENITSMKQAQAQLSESVAKYESLSQASPVGIILFDACGECVDVNRRWCEMTNTQREDALRNGWSEAIHVGDRDRMVLQWKLMSPSAISFHSEHRLRPIDAHTASVVCQGVKMTNSKGEITGGILTLTDITRQKQTEHALRLLSSDLATLSGTPFYDAVALRLAELVQCEFTFVCRRSHKEPEQLMTLALCENGVLHPKQDEFVPFALSREVVDRGSCIILSHVQEQYPDDAFLVGNGIEAYIGVRLINSTGRILGHLAAMSRRPFHDPDHIESVLKLFSLSVVAEMERQQLARRYSDLFEFSTDAIVLTDHDGMIVQVNRRVENKFGWKRTELEGQPVEMLMPRDIRALHIDLRRRFLESPTPSAVAGGRPNLTGLRKDGTTFPVDVSLSPIETADGIMIATSVRDVSERERSKEALDEAKVFADTVIESASGLFYVLNHDGVFVRWNQSMQDLLGLSSEEMGKTNVISIVYSADQALIASKMAEVLAAGQAFAEARLFLKTGVRHFLLNGRRLDINGKVYLVGSGADISDRKLAEEDISSLNDNLAQRVAERTAELTAANAELFKASQAKSEFLATMSHELRTPLNGILGMNELLLTTAMNDRQRQYVEACNSSGKLLLDLINDILDLSKIEAGKLELDPRECDILDLTDDVVAIMSHAAREKNLALRCDVADEACVAVFCDDNRLRQVLVNLIGNAIKFTTSGNIVVKVERVAARKRISRLRFSVSDTGIGIPSERLDRLFQAFSQVDSRLHLRLGCEWRRSLGCGAATSV